MVEVVQEEREDMGWSMVHLGFRQRTGLEEEEV